MGNYENLKQSITEVIRTNGNQEITGAVLQSTLLTIISTVGANATFAGIATPTTNPGTPDQNVFYLASEAGTYTNFGGVELQGGLSVLMLNGSSWSSQQMLSIDDVPTAGSDNLVKSDGINKSILDGWKLATAITTSVFDQNHKFWDLLGALKANVNYIIAITANSRVVSDVALRYTEPSSISAGEMIKANAVLNGTQYFKVTPSQDAKYLYLASVDIVGDGISSVVVYQQTNAAEILTKAEQKAEQYVLNSLLPYSTILEPIDIKTLLFNGASGYYRADGTLNAGGGGGLWTYYPAVTMKAWQCIVIKYNTFAQSMAYDTVASLAIKDSDGKLLQSFTPKYAYDNNFEIVYKAESDVTLYFSIFNPIGYNGYIYNTTPESIDIDYDYLFELFSAINNEAIESEGYSQNYKYEIFNTILVAGTKYILAINTNATITTDIYLRYTLPSSVADGELIAQGITLVAGETTYITVTPQEDTHYLYIVSASDNTNQVNFAIAYNTNSVSNDTPFIGDYIYTTFNDIGIAANTAGYAQRNMAAMLQIERLFKFDINKIPNVRFSEDREKVAIYAPFSDFNGTMNSNTAISGTTKVNKNTFSHNIDIKNCTKKVAFTQRSTCASNGITSKIKLLCIGDSITNLSGADYGRVSNGASVYWSWINQMFGMDYIENNTDNELINVGAQSSLEFGYTHKGVTKNVKGFAEGRGGWSTVDYISREWRNNEVGNYSGYNFFYNPNEAGDVKFSLDYYLTHYRTMDDSGNRLALADCGDRVKSSSEYNSLSAADKKKFRDYSDNCNVCTPTHIIIQLGTNDSNIDTAVANLEAIIRKIRTEGYTMPIAIAFPGQGGCYYPKLYQDYSADKILFEQAAVNKAQAVVTAYNELANELNTELGDVYFISIYSVQPCPHFETREINSPNVLVSGEKYSLCWGNQPKLHPDIFAHVNWAYQYYSWIKWTL